MRHKWTTVDVRYKVTHQPCQHRCHGDHPVSATFWKLIVAISRDFHRLTGAKCVIFLPSGMHDGRDRETQMSFNVQMIRLLVLLFLCSLFWGVARSETTAKQSLVALSGQVMLASGSPLAGAMVTLTDDAGFSTTVYSDTTGAWSLQASHVRPPLRLRARARGPWQDALMPVDEASLSGPVTLVVHPHSDPSAVSEQLAASAHAASIDWDDAETREDFISQCHFCHQIGNAMTRRPRSARQWAEVVRRMEGYGALLTWQNEKDFAHTLSAQFSGAPLVVTHTPEMHEELPSAVMREWAFGGPLNYVHDVEIGPDGLLYGVDMSADRIWILDRDTHRIDYVQWPNSGLPQGGMFSGAVAPLGTFDAHHGPHSIVHGPDNKLYTTNSLAAEIGIFDPVTRTTEFVPTGGDTIYPHTLRFDQKGTLWFTFALSNQIGRMDIHRKKITIIDLPSHGAWRWLADAMLPTVLKVASWFGKKDLHIALSHHKISGEGRDVLNLPYGLDVSPLDGSVWYSKLYSGYIGRVDPETLAVEEFKVPYSGPRRLRFGRDGVLWIPSFEAGVLSKFDTRSRTFVEHYHLPVLAENEYETPYAVGVEPTTGHVWIASNMSDRILRFDPVAERFVAYPSPTRVTFLRDFIFTPDGNVCTSNANLPAAAIEGGRPKLMCLKP